MNPNALIDLLEIANKQIDTQAELIKMLEEKIKLYENHVKDIDEIIKNA